MTFGGSISRLALRWNVSDIWMSATPLSPAKGGASSEATPTCRDYVLLQGVIVRLGEAHRCLEAHVVHFVSYFFYIVDAADVFIHGSLISGIRILGVI